jgi:hypothetical protein
VEAPRGGLGLVGAFRFVSGRGVAMMVVRGRGHRVTALLSLLSSAQSLVCKYRMRWISTISMILHSYMHCPCEMYMRYGDSFLIFFLLRGEVLASK